MALTSQELTVIELFAGVGGFRLGLERAGWETIWSNQWEPATKLQHAWECYSNHWGEKNNSNIDIAEALTQFESGIVDIPRAELIVGGFPCQDYSVAKSLSQAKGIEGKKGVLWWQIHRAAALFKPRFLLLENVDRLLKSPSSQRGRDFAIMLKSLGDLGYRIEWRVVNAAEYGFPQRRLRVFILAEKLDSKDEPPMDGTMPPSILTKAFPVKEVSEVSRFSLNKDLVELSNSFGLGNKASPFMNSGHYLFGHVSTQKVSAKHDGLFLNLADVLQGDSEVGDEFWIDTESLPQWEYLKGAKTIARVARSGHAYNYSEGSMGFPDALSKPSRTILTGEGGNSPSRFKHVVQTQKGLRRLTPIELERLNGFPDNWTRFGLNGREISGQRRAFLMGNALVVGLVERIGIALAQR